MTSQKKRQNWSKQCDDVFGWLVRTSGCCITCGSIDTIQCAHGFSRRYRATRWNFTNAFPQCIRCHMRYTHNPLAWDDWLRGHWGDRLYAAMRELALSGERVDTKARLAELRELERKRKAA